MKPSTILKLLKNIDALRRPQRMEKFLLACEADMRGRTGLEDRSCEQSDILRAALTAVQLVQAKPLADKGLKGPQIASELHRLRVAAIKAALQQLP
jgi:tRNA nucleotidyltransferase (CCA-adding enzyme)